MLVELSRVEVWGHFGVLVLGERHADQHVKSISACTVSSHVAKVEACLSLSVFINPQTRSWIHQSCLCCKDIRTKYTLVESSRAATTASNIRTSPAKSSNDRLRVALRLRTHCTKEKLKNMIRVAIRVSTSKYVPSKNQAERYKNHKASRHTAQVVNDDQRRYDT